MMRRNSVPRRKIPTPSRVTKYSLTLIAVAGISAAITQLGHSNDQPSSAGSDGSKLTDLPDVAWGTDSASRSRVERQVFDRTLIALQSEYRRLVSDRKSIMPSIIGQHLSAISLMEQFNWGCPPVPIVLRARYGIGGNKQAPYFAVNFLNLRRETREVIFLARSPEGSIIEIVYERELQFKEIEYQASINGEVRLTPWSKLLAEAKPDENGALKCIVTEINAIPLPDKDAENVLVAVADRDGRVSSFVPLSRVDFRNP